MNISINNKHCIVLEPGVFTFSDAFVMSKRVDDMSECGLDIRDVIKGYLEIGSIDCMHKALNLIVCLALHDEIIEYKGDNSSVSLFANPSNLSISTFDSLDKITINYSDGCSSPISLKLLKKDIVSIILNHNYDSHMIDAAEIALGREFALNDMITSVYNNEDNFNYRFFDKSSVNLMRHKSQYYIVDDI